MSVIIYVCISLWYVLIFLLVLLSCFNTKEEADRIMDEEQDLLSLPHGLPTVSSIDAARLEQEDRERFKAHDLFL